MGHDCEKLDLGEARNSRGSDLDRAAISQGEVLRRGVRPTDKVCQVSICRCKPNFLPCTSQALDSSIDIAIGPWHSYTIPHMRVACGRSLESQTSQLQESNRLHSSTGR